MVVIQDLSISELKKITEVVKEKFAYDFSNYASSSFKRRILRILELKRISLEQLIEMITKNQFTKDLFLNEITVNVTEMYRDPSFWKALRILITELLKNRDKIRIWHAGCSSGEEVYSMLILLKELNLINQVEIIASDIDSNILQRAKDGKISNKNMELHSSNYSRSGGLSDFNSYFAVDKDNSIFSRELISRVSFREIDLVKAIPFTKCDLILCRNVLIYFNQILQNNVLKLFSDCTFMGGHLVIGAKESIAWCDVASKYSTINLEEKIYKKIKE